MSEEKIFNPDDEIQKIEEEARIRDGVEFIKRNIGLFKELMQAELQPAVFPPMPEMEHHFELGVFDPKTDPLYLQNEKLIESVKELTNTVDKLTENITRLFELLQ